MQRLLIFFILFIILRSSTRAPLQNNKFQKESIKVFNKEIGQKGNKLIDSLSDNGTVRLIIRNPVVNDVLKIGKAGLTTNQKGEILYYNDGVPTFLKISQAIGKDTVVDIRTKSSTFVEIIHRVKAVEEFIIPVPIGSILELTYKNNLPHVELIKGGLNNWEVDFINNQLLRFGYSDTTFSSNFANVPYPLLQYRSKHDFLSDVKKEHSYLDSLIKNELISISFYDFFKRNLKHRENLRINQSIDFSKINFANILNTNATYLNESYYHNLIQFYIFKHIEKLPIIKNNTGFSKNMNEVFYKVLNDTTLNNEPKEIALYYVLNNIFSGTPNQSPSFYLEKFSTAFPFSRYLQKLIDDYNLDMSENELNIKGIDNKEITFDQLIKKLKGNYVYIDFWASWCAPCRKSFEYSVPLRAGQLKDFVVIYLAWNDNEDSWRLASKEESIDQYKHNFIIQNSKSSAFLRELNLESIPRYILYDKNGNLITKRAPSPDSISEIKSLISNF